MLMRIFRLGSICLLAVFIVLIHPNALRMDAQSPLTLYTPYTGISVSPGESVDYSVEVINESSTVQHVTFALRNLKEGWKYQLTSGGWKLNRLSVKPGASETVNLEVEVPLQVQKGDYPFVLVATGNNGVQSTLPITINVSEGGTYQTEFTTDQPNMEGDADSTFTFHATLKNRTAVKQHYALSHEAPRGWDVDFKSDGNSVTSVTLDSNASKEITIDIDPPEDVKEGTYKIPVKASTNETSGQIELEVVITGTYQLELGTPNEVLSTDIKAGQEKTIDLEVTNKGSGILRDISFSSDAPVNWEVTFEPEKIQKLDPGQSAEVKAKIKASDKAIAGDYMINMKASAPEDTSEVQFRITVKTSLLWGWIGILIIAAVIAGIYYLIRTYGRR